MAQQPVSGPFKFRVGDIVNVRFEVTQVLKSGRLEMRSTADHCLFVQEPHTVELVERPTPPRPTVPFIAQDSYGRYYRGLPGKGMLVDLFDGGHEVTWEQLHNCGYVTTFERKENA